MCSRHTRKVNSFPADRSISFRLPFSRLVQTAALALRHEAPPSGHPFAQAPGAKDHHPQRAHPPPVDAAPDAVGPLPSVRSREPTCTRSGSTAGTKRGRYMDTSGAKAEEFRGVLFCLYFGHFRVQVQDRPAVYYNQKEVRRVYRNFCETLAKTSFQPYPGRRTFSSPPCEVGRSPRNKGKRAYRTPYIYTNETEGMDGERESMQCTYLCMHASCMHDA